MDISTLIEICQSYSDLGFAIQDQLKDVVRYGDCDGANLNATRIVVRWLEQTSHMVGRSTQSDNTDLIGDLEMIADDIKQRGHEAAVDGGQGGRVSGPPPQGDEPCGPVAPGRGR